MARRNGHSIGAGRIASTAVLVAVIAVVGIGLLSPTAAAQDDECITTNENNCERVGPFSFGEDVSIDEAILDAYFEVSPLVRGTELIVDETIGDPTLEDGCRPASEVDGVEVDTVGSTEPVVCTA